MSFLSLYYYAMLGWILWGVSFSQVQKYLRQGTLSRTFQLFLGERTFSRIHSNELTALLSFQFVVNFYVLFLPPNKPNVLVMAFVFLLRFFSPSLFVVIVKWNIIKKEKLNIAIFCRLLWM